MSYAVIERLVASPACNPTLTLDEALCTYAVLGFQKFEAFTNWPHAAVDWTGDPQRYLDVAAFYGITYTSFHLPAIDDDLERSLDRAVCAARFADALGAEIVLYKATSRQSYVRAAGAFLDAIETLDLTSVGQNHFGTPVSSLDDVREVHEGIQDSRMRALLEVGHFHTAGVSWQEALDYLGDRVALVHIKDQVGGQSVPYGTGEIDLPGLFAALNARGYGGDYVGEMEVEDREHTIAYLRDALAYIRTHWPEG